jgi:hypothetical protein
MVIKTNTFLNGKCFGEACWKLILQYVKIIYPKQASRTIVVYDGSSAFAAGGILMG